VSPPEPLQFETAVELPLLTPPHCDRASDPPAETRPRELPSDLLRMLYRQVRGLAGPRADLDDLVQEAAERVLKSWHRFEGRSAVSTWTYGIAYRTMIDHDRWYQRWRRRFSLTHEDSPEPEHEFDGEESVVELERARRLHVVLAELPAAKRAVVVLHELEGLEMKQVAEIVGTNERTVRSRLRDARKKLVELLADDPLFGKEAP
jgi:RNA polymerase sigma-70 factor (ECF subfamily)